MNSMNFILYFEFYKEKFSCYMEIMTFGESFPF